MAKKTPETRNEERLDLSYESTPNCPRCGMKMSIERANLIKLGTINLDDKCENVICK